MLALPGIERTNLDPMLADAQVGGQRAAPKMPGRRGFRRAVVATQCIGLVIARIFREQSRVGLFDPGMCSDQMCRITTPAITNGSR